MYNHRDSLYSMFAKVIVSCVYMVYIGTCDASRGSHCSIPCTSTCDGDFTDILIPYANRLRKGGVATRARSYTRPFTTRNQRIKTLEKLGQAIKQAPRYESSDQGLIFEIKIFDRRRSWKYRAYSGDYPLCFDLQL